jgi:hypothetical protein
MFSNKNRINRIVGLAFTAGLLLSCVKQRPELVNQQDQLTQILRQEAPLANKAWTFSQSSNSFIKTTNYTISTGNTLIKSQNSIAKELRVEPEVGIQFLDVVRFKSDHPALVQGVDEYTYLLGEENKKYPIVEELTPTHLILYKLVDSQDLSFNEITIARAFNGKFIVPIGGFEVTYLRRERVVNEDNRKTNLIDYFEVPAKEYRTATDFRFDQYAFIPFDRFVKMDVIDKKFFSKDPVNNLPDYEWYFSETTVEVRHDGANAVGDLGGADSNFLSASRVRFCIFDDQMVALNTNADEAYKNRPCDINHNIVMRFKIEHRDFTWINQGNNALKEIEDSTEDKLSKRYIKLMLLESETIKTALESFFQSIFGGVQNFRSVEDVTYGKDYFSFSVRDALTETIRRYSFRKVIPEEKITPRLAYRDDNMVFGTFATRKYKKNDYEFARLSDVENLLLMARHNPNKDIVYHFTKQTPCQDPRPTYCVNHDPNNPNRDFDPEGKWIRDIGRESISLWNQAFKKAGLKIQVRLNEEKDVELGDIRYNVLNIVNRAGQGLLGFGPSLIDTETGEIVSASMNTGIENILNQNFFAIRDYVNRASGYHYNFKQDNEDTSIRTRVPNLQRLIQQVNSAVYVVDPHTGDLSLNGSTTIGDNLLEKEKEFLSLIGIAPNSSVKEFVEKITAVRLHAHKYNLPSVFAATLFSERDMNFTSTQVVDAAIQKNCPEVVSMAERLKKQPFITTPEEIEIISPCAHLLAQGEAVLTTVHELGHNLSLRHNFRGSVDKDNYPQISDYQIKYVKAAEGLIRPMTSSIMEYTTSEGQQWMPGNYDVAAVRWIYGEEVPLKNGSFVKMPPAKINKSDNVVIEQKKISDVVSKKDLKPYQFCTDEQRILVTDPLCIAFDNGTNAQEIARFMIEEVYNALGYSYRYDRRGASLPAATLALRGRSLKAIYDQQWRGFLRKYTGTNKSYLQGYTLSDYQRLIDSIRKRGEDEARLLEEHLQFRNMFVRFLVDISFISNKYCVVKDSENVETLIELEKIRKELFGIGDYTVIDSCQSPSAAQYIVDNKYTFVREFGHFLDSGTFNQDPNRLEFQDIYADTNPLDFTGTFSSRMVAMSLLTSRSVFSINNDLDGFYPSLLDEPDVRNYVQFLIQDRLVNGVRMAHDNSKSEYSLPKNDLFGKEEVEKLQKQPVFVNYNQEANLVQLFTLFMSENLWMPGTQDDGRRSYVNVSVGDPSQIDDIRRIAADYYEYLDRVLYVRDRNTFAGQVMGRFKFLNTQKQRLQFSPEQISGAQLQALSVLNSSNALFPPLKNGTVLDVVNLVLAIEPKFQELFSKEETQPVGFILSNLLQTEFMIMGQLQQVLQASGVTLEQILTMQKSQNPEEKAMAEALLSQPVAPIYAQLQSQIPGIAQPTYPEMNRRFTQFFEMHTKEYKNFDRSAEEYDSQIDVLQRVIQILSR